jgi:hypothetical protein
MAALDPVGLELSGELVNDTGVSAVKAADRRQGSGFGRICGE